jgi:hypothetical protein
MRRVLAAAAVCGLALAAAAQPASHGAPREGWKRFSNAGGFGGITLTLYTDSSCAFLRTTDVADQPRDSGNGSYSIQGDQLIFHPPGDSSFAGIAAVTAYHVVPWGSVEVLADDSTLLEICNYCNLRSRWDPDRHDPWGPPFLKTGAPPFPPLGTPRLPAPWNAFLLDAPITAEIVRADSIGHLLTINKGALDRVFTGAMFCVTPGGLRIEQELLSVVEVRDHEADCRFTGVERSIARLAERGDAPLAGELARLDALMRLPLHTRVSTAVPDRAHPGEGRHD